MSIGQAVANKELVQKFYNVIESEDFDGAGMLCHPDFRFYLHLDEPISGVEGVVKSEKKNFDMFDVFSFRIYSVMAETDQVAAFMIFDGVQARTVDGTPKPKTRVRFSRMMLLTIKDGLIIEKRAHIDHKDVDRQTA